MSENAEDSKLTNEIENIIKESSPNFVDLETPEIIAKLGNNYSYPIEKILKVIRKNYIGKVKDPEKFEEALQQLINRLQYTRSKKITNEIVGSSSYDVPIPVDFIRDGDGVSLKPTSKNFDTAIQSGQIPPGGKTSTEISKKIIEGLLQTDPKSKLLRMAITPLTPFGGMGRTLKEVNEIAKNIEGINSENVTQFFVVKQLKNERL